MRWKPKEIAAMEAAGKEIAAPFPWGLIQPQF